MTDVDADAVIVGAGPAGAAAALLLARAGRSVVLVDRARFPRGKPCAEYLSPGVLTILERLDVGPLPAHRFPGMEIISPDGRRFRVTYQRAGTCVSAASLARRDLDAALVAAARRAGVTVLEGFTARGPLVRGGVVTGILGRDGCGEHHLRARLTLAADGTNSRFARLLGLRRPARWPVRLGLVAHYRGDTDLPDGFGQMHVWPGGYCGLAPLPDGGLNVAMVLPLDRARHDPRTPTQLFEHHLATHPRLADALRSFSREDPVRGVGPVGSRVSRATTNGALLLGDAAGFFDPFTGEGIFRALRSAELATPVILAALERDDVSAAALAAYEQQRYAAFSTKQTLTTLVQLFVRWPFLLDYALPRLAARPTYSALLSNALGDVADPRDFLRPPTLWHALRP